MPMSRYELRNQFTLADPELYRAADKDDPEALLEGVAMAGLVGLLRQLGDLAEFAAEIFHDLHEEVIATAARGHGLMIRVQQLEAEAPSIEKALLSQTDHSSFSYSAGVEWHPSPQMEKNLVTQGDLPRFIMDSYEECRGPPRLFLLDKFDVAGAGACLKRYTDPSFFKVELSSSEMIDAEVQRKKKILRAKKKGPRWKNGETTPEGLTSHVKLNQLYTEERVENGVSYSTHRVKLKRRLNGFPFDSNTGKSYMEELLKTTFSEYKELHEVTMKSLIVPASNHNESGLEALEVGLMSPDRESMERKRSPPPSPDRLEIVLKQSIYKPNEAFIDDEISEAPNLYPDTVNKDIALTLDMVTNKEDMTVDGESKPEGSLTDYQSDDISSEIDNYVDAPSTMESEMDTDTELRVKSDITSSFTQRHELIPDANEKISDTNEEQATTPADSHSTENSTISNDGNDSSGKELSSFTPSDSPSTSTENTESACDVTAISSPSVDAFESSTIDMPSYHKITQEDLPVSLHSKSVISDDTCTGTAAVTNHRSDLDQLTSILSPVDMTPTLAHFDLEDVSKEGWLRGPESNETFCPLDQEDKRANLVIDQSCSPSPSDSEMQSGDNSPRFSGGDHLVDKSNGESIPCLASISGNLCQISDSSLVLSADFLHDWNSDQEDLNLSVNEASTSNICNALPQNTDDTLPSISIENPNSNLNESDDGITKVPETSISISPGIAHNGDSFTSTISEREKLMDDLDNEDPHAFSCASCIMEASLGKKFEETSVQNVDIAGQHSNSSVGTQLGSENYILSHVEHSLDWHGENLDAQYSNGVIPGEQMPTTETPAVRILKFCEVGLQNTEVTGDVHPHDSVALGSSCCDLEKLGKISRTSDSVVTYKNTLCTSPTGKEITEISSSSCLTSLNEVHVQLDATDCQRDQSETGVMGISVPAIAGSGNKDGVSLLVDLDDKLVQGSIPCFEDSGRNKINNGNNCLSGCHGESDLLDIVSQRAAATSDLSNVSCNTLVHGNLKLEISDTVLDSYLELVVERSLDLESVTTIQSSLEQTGFDTDQECFTRSSLGNHVSDTASLTVDCSDEETILQEKIETSPNEFNQNLLNSDEINSESSTLLPINPGQMLDHDHHIVGSNIASAISHVNWSCPLSISEFPGKSNYVIDVSGHPKEPLGSTSPPSNLFSETNQPHLEELPPLPPLPPVQWRMGKLQHASSASEGEIMPHNKLYSLGVFPPTTSIDDASSSHEVPNQSLNQIVPDTTSKEVKDEKSSSSLEANNMMHETNDLPQSTENEKQQLLVSSSESEFISPAVENEVANGSHTDKVPVPRPRNPLMDAVAAIDKSKLRKVTERVRPEIQKLDERDSLLEQIRTKSFNLKPALASRPSIRGPKTNLKVAAILEKANAIRQALADSDEDDEDGWSDS